MKAKANSYSLTSKALWQGTVIGSLGFLLLIVFFVTLHFDNLQREASLHEEEQNGLNVVSAINEFTTDFVAGRDNSFATVRKEVQALAKHYPEDSPKLLRLLDESERQLIVMTKNRSNKSTVVPLLRTLNELTLSAADSSKLILDSNLSRYHFISLLTSFIPQELEHIAAQNDGSYIPDDLQHLHHSLSIAGASPEVRQAADAYQHAKTRTALLASLQNLSHQLTKATQTRLLRAIRREKTLLLLCGVIGALGLVSSLFLNRILYLRVAHTYEKLLAQIQLSEERHRLLVDSVHDGIWDWDLGQGSLYLSPTWKAQLGYRDHELANTFQNWRGLLAESDVPAFDQLLKACAETRKSHDQTLHYIAKSGEVHVIRCRAFAVADEAGQLRRIIGAHTDLTEELKLQKELAQAHIRQLATARLSALGGLASGVAHEINNPLAVLSAQTDIMLKQLDSQKPLNPARLRASYTIIQNHVERIAKIVHGLQCYSHEGSRAHMIVTSIQSIIDDALSLCSQRFKDSGIRLAVQVSQQPALLQCRPGDISQILVNLLLNAYDAVVGLSERWVSLSLDTNAASIQIRVADSGPGVAADIEDKIMDPFFTTKVVGEGTGLGLSISLGYARDHGGTLAFDRTRSASCFTLQLPRYIPAEASAKAG